MESWVKKNKHEQYPDIPKQRVEEIVEKLPQKWKTAAYFLWLFGCRANELLSLRKRDFKREDDWVIVNVAFSKRGDKKSAIQDGEFKVDNRDRHGIYVYEDAPFISEILDQVRETEGLSELVWGIRKHKDKGYHRLWKAFDRLNYNIAPHFFRHHRADNLTTVSMPENEDRREVMKQYFGWAKSDTADEYIKERGERTKSAGRRVGKEGTDIEGEV